MLLVMALLAFGATRNSYGETIVLYDGSLNTTPDQQGWKYITNPLPPPFGPGSSAVQSASGGATNLDTTAKRDEQAGYFSKVEHPSLPSYSHPLVPQLERYSGFAISFQVQILKEIHDKERNNRAGFNVIVITNDLKGLELGFWINEVFALEDDVPDFSRDEETAFDTTTGLVTYDLSISGDTYEFLADGVTILSGPLRDYSSFGPPYDIADFLFFGDDTTSASAKIRLASIAFKKFWGDINDDKSVDLADAVLALQVCADTNPSGIVSPDASSDSDVNHDGKIGLEELIYILQEISGLRN